jgi:histone arginine demethylase JMJD6
MKFAIERRSNLSYTEFAQNYMFANTPVIITDAIRKWPALSRWTPEFFKTEFGSMKFTIDEGEFSYVDGKQGKTEFTMEQFIDRVLESTKEHPAPYFRNRILYDEFPALNQDIQPLLEYFFPNWLSHKYWVKYVRQVLNRGSFIEIFIGGQGGSFPTLHYDGCAAHAFLMQVYGHKEYVLYSPDQEPFLYPSPVRQNVSAINSIEKPDLNKFPLFAKAVPTIFRLDPGETLFIPSRWWHTVFMLTPCITLSINVANRSNWKALVDFVAKRRSNNLEALVARIYLTAAGMLQTLKESDFFDYFG